MSCDDSVKNEHDIFRLTLSKRGQIILRKKMKRKGILSAFLRFVIHVYQWSNSNAPHTHFTVIFLRQLVICDTVPLQIFDMICWFSYIKGWDFNFKVFFSNGKSCYKKQGSLNMLMLSPVRLVTSRSYLQSHEYQALKSKIKLSVRCKLSI